MAQFNFPKGPTQNKFIQTQLFTKAPTKLLEDCRKAYGKTFTLHLLGHSNCVFISEPADLKQVFTAKSDQLNAGEINAALLEPVLGEYSLLCLDGKKHIAHRKLLLPPFHGDRMQSYAKLIAEVAQKKSSQWKSGETFSVLHEAREMTFSVILNAVFGMNEENSRYDALAKALHAFMNEITKPFSFMILMIPYLHINLGFLTPWAKMMKLRRAVDVCLFEEIEARKKMDLSDRVDILSLLLQAKDEEGNLMSHHEIRDEMLTLLLAGHETSSVGIAWAIYGILSNESVLKKIKKELKDVIIDKNDWISHIDKLVYLDAIVKETLRITPVVANVARVTKEDGYQLGEYVLPKGTVIMPAIYLTHRDSALWPDAEQFMPERFLNATETPYTYFPFGGGTRRCIGAAFALYEMKIIIAQIFLQTELKLKENYMPKPERKGAVIAPSEGVPVEIV